MSIADPRDCLAFHQSRVLCQHRDLSGTPMSVVSASLKQAINTMGEAQPETEALAFYGLHHAVALISAARDKFEPLPPEELGLVEAYHERSVREALRAFYYLLVICARESRHNYSLDKDMPALSAKFGPAVAGFHDKVHGGEAQIYKKLMTEPPLATLGKYCQSLQWVFYNSSWGSSFGGKKWGAVADCLVRFVTGEYTAEMMMDTVWTLCHNGGPIFNKGVLYHHWDQYLIRILDVQRSGQIPEMMIEGDAAVLSHAEGAMTERMLDLQEMFPDKVGSYVDWWRVETLGSKHKYEAEKKTQAVKHGVPAHAAEHEKQAAIIAAAEAKKAAEKQAKFEKENWPMTVDAQGKVVYVKKIDRKAA